MKSPLVMFKAEPIGERFHDDNLPKVLLELDSHRLVLSPRYIWRNNAPERERDGVQYSIEHRVKDELGVSSWALAIEDCDDDSFEIGYAVYDALVNEIMQAIVGGRLTVSYIPLGEVAP